MSITIRYSGQLSDLDQVASLTEEFKDIAETSGWPHEIVDGVFSSLKQFEVRRLGSAEPQVKTLNPPLTLRGIKVTVHPQTDPLWLTFDPRGTLTRLGYYALEHYSAKRPGQPVSRRYEFVHQSQASIQTSVGGAELHRLTVRLLEHLKKNYVPQLVVLDDTGYWEDRNDLKLKSLMACV